MTLQSMFDTSVLSRKVARRGSVGGMILAALLAAHCSSESNEDCASTNSCSPASAEGGTDSPALPSSCDLTKPLAETPYCIDDTVGIFVSRAARMAQPARVRTRSARSLPRSRQRLAMREPASTSARASSIRK